MTNTFVFRHPHAFEHLTHRAAIAASPEAALDSLHKQNVPSPSIRQLEVWDEENKKWISAQHAHALF